MKSVTAVEKVMASKTEGHFNTATGEGFFQNAIGLDLALEHAEELDRLRVPTGKSEVKEMNMNCIVCENELEMYGNRQPLDGLCFSTSGHYGSTFFDPMDGTLMHIAVCDNCLSKKSKYCYYEDS